MFSRGYFTVGRLRGVPVRIHLTTPVGLFVLSGFAFNPWLWGAYLLIILVHEFGHAWFVRRYRLPVLSVDVSGIGGVCRYAGAPTELQRSVIAWGGVLGQGVLLAITEAIGKSVGFQGEVLGPVMQMLVAVNVMLIVFNLLPLPGFDGSEAWALFRWRNLQRLGQRGRRAALKSRAASIERQLSKGRPRSERGGDPWSMN